jgi:hypothetical protein
MECMVPTLEIIKHFLDVQLRFLLAQLHLDSLTDKTSPKAIKLALKRLPKGSDGLNIAYDEAMGRILTQKPGFRELAEQVLSWITYAQRPLTVRELQHALAVEPGEPELDEDNLSDVAELVSSCAGLVTVDQESDIVRLVHYTTQEYFDRVRLERFPRAEQHIATTCLSYLLFDVFLEGHCSSDKVLEARLQRHALLDYAARYWGVHFREDAEQAEKALALDFLTSDSKISCSVQVMQIPEFRYKGYSQHAAENVSGIHLCAYFGLQGLITELFRPKIRADSRDRYGRTPLSRAAAHGHEAVVKLLVERDDLAADSREEDGRTPLFWAGDQGHEQVA